MTTLTAPPQSAPAAPVFQPSDFSIQNSSFPLLPYLPPASLTLLLGDPGIGKSLLALTLAAHLSRGHYPFPTPNSEFTTHHSEFAAPTLAAPAPPPSPCHPVTLSPCQSFRPALSAIFSAEDTKETILDRITNAAGNPQRIVTFSLVNTGERRLDNIPAHFKEALQINPKLNLKLLILDPVTPLLGNIDPRRAAAVRDALAPLSHFATTRNAAILMIHHLNKSTRPGSSPLHRAMDSLAFPAVARSVLYLTTHRGERVLVSLKSNLTAPPPPLAIQISPTGLLTLHPTPYTTAEIMGTPTANLPDPTPTYQSLERDEARLFLQSLLASGPRPATQIINAARQAGISVGTLRRAKSQAGITVHHDGPTNRWLWQLPT